MRSRGLARVDGKSISVFFYAAGARDIVNVCRARRYPLRGWASRYGILQREFKVIDAEMRQSRFPLSRRAPPHFPAVVSRS